MDVSPKQMQLNKDKRETVVRAICIERQQWLIISLNDNNEESSWWKRVRKLKL